MANVFISYSQKNREDAIRVAAFLEAAGISTWWDAGLVPGDQFRQRIETELDQAAVVLVIWSYDSIASRFVLDEADRAASGNKLISVLTDGFSSRYIPMGFGNTQAVDIGNTKKLVEALKIRGLTSKSESPASFSEAIGWTVFGSLLLATILWAAYNAITSPWRVLQWFGWIVVAGCGGWIIAGMYLLYRWIRDQSRIVRMRDRLASNADEPEV